MAEVRQIQPGEWSLLKRVRLAALTDAPDAFSSTLERESLFSDDIWRERTRDSAEGAKSFCAIAFDGDEGVGIAVGLSDAENAAHSYLVSMRVAPRFRGTKVTPSLVEAVASWATLMGASVLFAGVTPNNERALAFYRKAGFERYSGSPPNHPATAGCNLVIARAV